MHYSRVLSLCALVALSVSAGCSGCDPKKTDPIPPGATCTDSVKNGAETGVDCGGATCVAEGKTCAVGVGCAAPADCTSTYCNATTQLCATQCTDAAKDGTETDVDCGGSCVGSDAKTCALGFSCAIDADCASGSCDAITKVCVTPCTPTGNDCPTGAGACCSGFCDTTVTPNKCAEPCLQNGKTCATGSQCCTGLCTGSPLACASCVANGGACTGVGASSSCCSGYCNGTTCAEPCGSNGVSCATGADCCTGNCTGSPLSCAPAGTCTNNGGACTGVGASSSCCSGYCNGTACADPCKSNGVSCAAGTDCCTGICTGSPLACASCVANGSACTGVGPSSACCSGYCNGTACANPCKSNGTTCGFSSECCSDYCDPSKVCGTFTCKADGTSCGADADCCGGYCDPVKHQCAPPVSICKLSGAACTNNGDCCSSACDNPTNGTLAGACTTTLFCKTPGAACVNSGECCSGTCTGGLCSDTICKQSGTACTAPTDCCTGSCATTCQTLPAPTGTAACKTLYDSCTLDTDCCSTNCQDGKCTPAYTCHAASDLCFRPQDCCSGMCTAPATQTSPPTPGRCLPPSGGCNQDGNPCAGASNCCTRICSDLGSGATVCKPAGGCRMTGDFCDRTAACCGGSDPTNPGAVESPYGVYCDGPATVAGPTEWDPSSKNDRTCTGGQACNPPGNICGGSGATNASQNCCDGKKEVCKQDSGGIWRCFGGWTSTCTKGWDANDPDCCIAAGTTANPGGVCQFRDQCCNGAPCVPDASGVLRCTIPSCTAIGGACEGADDPSCCAGTVCTYDDVHGTFSCQVPAICTPNAGACTVASDCCSNNCVNGRCAPPCASASGSCTYDSDCCAGLGCKIPPGATSGTCESASTCAPTGGSCVADADCCNAPTEACIEGACAVPASCGSQYQSCTTGADCCSPLNCVEPDGRACASATGCSCDQCIYSGQSCTQGATPGCCFGLTCTSGGTCQQCGGVSATCGGTGDCCSGLVCTNPMGQECNTPGCGVCDSCIVDGQACTAAGGLYCCGSASCVSDPGSLSPCAPEDPTCGCVATGG